MSTPNQKLVKAIKDALVDTLDKAVPEWDKTGYVVSAPSIYVAAARVAGAHDAWLIGTYSIDGYKEARTTGIRFRIPDDTEVYTTWLDYIPTCEIRVPKVDTIHFRVDPNTGRSIFQSPPRETCTCPCCMTRYEAEAYRINAEPAVPNWMLMSALLFILGMVAVGW